MNDFETVKETIGDALEKSLNHDFSDWGKIADLRAALITIHWILFGCKPGKMTEEARPKKGVAHGS